MWRRDIIVLSSNATLLPERRRAGFAPMICCSKCHSSALGKHHADSRCHRLNATPLTAPAVPTLTGPCGFFSVRSGFGICSFVSVLLRNLLDYAVSESLCLLSGSLGCRSQPSRVCARRTCVCVCDFVCARATEPGARKPSFPLFLRIASACVYLRV